MKKQFLVIALAVCFTAIVVLAVFTGINTAKTKDQNTKVNALENEIAKVKDKGYITEAQANTLISAAIAGKLTTAEVNALINAATSGFLTTAQVNNLIDAAIGGFLTQSQIDALISDAISGLITGDALNTAIDNLLGIQAVITIEDFAWVMPAHYISVGFNFNWTSFEHVDSIIVTVYNGNDIVGKSSTTGMKLALALTMDGFDYEEVRANGQLTCPIGFGSDAYWKQQEFDANVCTFTRVEVQINANHKTYTATAYDKTETQHSFTIGEIVPPTCKHDDGGAQQGYTVDTCIFCGETHMYDFVPAYKYKPGCAECLAEKKLAAIAEFTEFCDPYLQDYLDANDYAKLARFSGIADDFITDVNNATTLDEVDEILAKAKAKFLNLYNLLHRKSWRHRAG